MTDVQPASAPSSGRRARGGADARRGKGEFFRIGGPQLAQALFHDLERLIRVITGFRQRWGQHIQVYLEPGEAIGIGTGVLVGTVLDLVHNGVDIAIIDVSATCHMPDTLEMPYRADIMDADLPGKLPHTYRLGSVTCLAGDVIGDYSFPAPLKIGQRLVFMDMSHYTFVKNTTFNGVPLPAIASFDPAFPLTDSKPGSTKAAPLVGLAVVVRHDQLMHRLAQRPLGGVAEHALGGGGDVFVIVPVAQAGGDAAGIVLGLALVMRMVEVRQRVAAALAPIAAAGLSKHALGLLVGLDAMATIPAVADLARHKHSSTGQKLRRGSIARARHRSRSVCAKILKRSTPHIGRNTKSR